MPGQSSWRQRQRSRRVTKRRTQLGSCTLSSDSANTKNSEINSRVPKPEKHPKQEPVGLINQGATCHLNSLLQVLFAIPEIRQSIYDCCFEGDEMAILRKVQQLFVDLEMETSTSISTKGLTDALKWSEKFCMMEHQDVCETQNTILGALEQHSDTKIAVELFRGTMSHQTACAECGVVISGTAEEFRNIPVPLGSGRREVLHLGKCIRRYFAKEYLGTGVQFFCQGCTKMVQVSRKAAILEAPRYLALQISRFEYDERGQSLHKLGNKVKCPLNLTLDRHLVGGEDSEQQDDAGDGDRFPPSGGCVQRAWSSIESSIRYLFGRQKVKKDKPAVPASVCGYELHSIISHSGNLEHGHYVAHVRAGEDHITFNDSNVSTSGVDSISTVVDGYVAIYRHTGAEAIDTANIRVPDRLRVPLTGGSQSSVKALPLLELNSATRSRTSSWYESRPLWPPSPLRRSPLP